MKVARKPFQFLSVPLAGLLCFASSVTAAQTKDGTLTVLVENDTIAGVDKHYTSGVQVSYLTSPSGLSEKWKNAFSVIPGVNDNERMRVGFQAGHSIFTPNDIQTDDLLRNERPYAAWAYGGFAVVSETDDTVNTWLLNLGRIGPSAKGEAIQNSVHELVGAARAEGWDNQLEDTTVASLVYEHRWRNLWQTERSRFGVDVNSHLGFSFGNLTNYVNAGVTVRVGNDLQNGFAPPPHTT